MQRATDADNIESPDCRRQALGAAVDEVQLDARPDCRLLRRLQHRGFDIDPVNLSAIRGKSERQQTGSSPKIHQTFAPLHLERVGDRGEERGRIRLASTRVKFHRARKATHAGYPTTASGQAALSGAFWAGQLPVLSRDHARRYN
jgi:hypothetical protein